MLSILVCAQQKSGNEHSPQGSMRLRSSQHWSRRLLSRPEGLAVTEIAMQTEDAYSSVLDCSHLVHQVYERAGLPYAYATSGELYRGRPEFHSVLHPQSGDLIVWHGHVGIVIDPIEHSFFSALRSGPQISSYHSPYWLKRGHARFLRYLGVSTFGRARYRSTYIYTLEAKGQ